MRSSQAVALFGLELAQKLKETRVLVVGSGGIGCELRKSRSSSRPNISSTLKHLKLKILSSLGLETLLYLISILSIYPT